MRTLRSLGSAKITEEPKLGRTKIMRNKNLLKFTKLQFIIISNSPYNRRLMRGSFILNLRPFVSVSCHRDCMGETVWGDCVGNLHGSLCGSLYESLGESIGERSQRPKILWYSFMELVSGNLSWTKFLDWFLLVTSDRLLVVLIFPTTKEPFEVWSPIRSDCLPRIVSFVLIFKRELFRVLCFIWKCLSQPKQINS